MGQGLTEPAAGDRVHAICANGVEQAAHHDTMSQSSLLHYTLYTLDGCLQVQAAWLTPAPQAKCANMLELSQACMHARCGMAIVCLNKNPGGYDVDERTLERIKSSLAIL